MLVLEKARAPGSKPMQNKTPHRKAQDSSGRIQTQHLSYSPQSQSTIHVLTSIFGVFIPSLITNEAHLVSGKVHREQISNSNIKTGTHILVV